MMSTALLKKGPIMKTLRSIAPRLILACLLAPSAMVLAAPTFVPNSQPTGWVAEVDVSSFDFSAGGQTIYKPDFIRANWSGNLYAFPVSATGAIDFVDERWDNGVADNLDAQNYNTGRFIATMKSDGSKIPFRWASLGSTQQTALGTATLGPKVLDYVRGDRSNESPAGALYRIRASALGDIVHSRPLFVDNADITRRRVYVGANDGMLHAFNAATGNEVFAYVPSMLIPTLPALTVNPYVHNYYVDASPNAREVDISGKKTILVGGLGAGGKGLYALNITDPTAADEAAVASKILWEITPTTINNGASASYADLGHTYGTPLIVKLSDGTWAAIVGNGYNNAGSYQAVLYVINLATGVKIAGITATVAGVSAASPNGLSSPAGVDADGDGKVDYVYAGDINGNMWKFDLRTIASPVVTKLYTTSPAQPITGRPAVSLHASGGYMINFATGQMFTSADALDATTVYYAYGIRDNGTTIADANIVSQTLTAKSWTATGGFNYAVRVSSSIAVNYSASPP